MEDIKIKNLEMKFLRAILNKTKKDRIRNINKRLELGVDETKNDIQKSRLRCFWYAIWMTKERIPKKMLHKIMDGKRPKERPRTRCIDQIRKWKMGIQKTNRKGANRVAGDFSVIVDPYFWKGLRKKDNKLCFMENLSILVQDWQNSSFQKRSG